MALKLRWYCVLINYSILRITGNVWLNLPQRRINQLSCFVKSPSKYFVISIHILLKLIMKTNSKINYKRRILSGHVKSRHFEKNLKIFVEYKNKRQGKDYYIFQDSLMRYSPSSLWWKHHNSSGTLLKYMSS